MSTKIVNDLLRELGVRPVYTIPLGVSVREAAGRMLENHVGALVVINQRGEIAGIISERDITTKVVPFGINTDATSIDAFMTQKVETVSLLTNLTECEDLMKKLQIRHLPVVDKGELVAVISIRDLLVSTRDENKELVAQLEDYIHPFSRRQK